MSLPVAVVPTRPATLEDERFAALWRAHYGPVLAYAQRRASAWAAAEVTDAAFTVLWRRIDDPPAEPLPWLYAVARHELANHRRGESRRRAAMARLASRIGRSSAQTAPDVAEGAVESSLARTALARLKPADREILMLVAWEGLDPARAAAVLGVSEATFAVRLHRARRRLEAQLSANPEESQP